MSAAAVGLRMTALMSVGSLVVHQGRYGLGYGERAPEALAEQGHAYLTLLGALAALLLAVASGHLLAAIAGRCARGGARRRSFVATWAAAAAALATAYLVQESLEGWLAAGHPSGVAGVLGQGGWTALVLAVAVGALVAALARGAEAIVAGGSPLRSPSPRRPLDVRWPLAAAALSRSTVLARHMAGRAPPLAV